jgi:hypothetical protein
MDGANLVGGTAADRQLTGRGLPAISPTPVKAGKQGESSIPS